MTIEQTNQLIQLILNSVVMVAACILLLNGLLRRYAVLSSQLQHLQHQYFDLLSEPESLQAERRTRLKTQLHRLRHRYRSAQFSVMAIHYALLFLVGSTLLVALRTLIGADGLIVAALALFVVGIGILLLSVGLTLHDLQLSNRSVWEELRWVLKREEGDRGSSQLKLSHSFRRPRSKLNPAARSISTRKSRRVPGDSPGVRVG